MGRDGIGWDGIPSAIFIPGAFTYELNLWDDNSTFQLQLNHTFFISCVSVFACFLLLFGLCCVLAVASAPYREGLSVEQNAAFSFLFYY